MSKNDKGKDVVEEKVDPNQTTPTEKSPEENPGEELKTPEEAIEYWKNKYFYALADVRNVSNEWENRLKMVSKYSFQLALEKLLPTLDAFEVSLKVPTTSSEVSNFLIGFQYIYSLLLQTLANEGVEEIVPKVGEAYDYRLHHATETVDVAKEADAEKIHKLILKGFRIQDRIVRSANVVVTKFKAPK